MGRRPKSYSENAATTENTDIEEVEVIEAEVNEPNKKDKPNTIETVNLIEYRNGEILNMWSFHDDDVGNDEANNIFKSWCRDRLYTEEETNNYFDDGFCRHRNSKMVIFHSTK
jgi:hypothetical protein